EANRRRPSFIDYARERGAASTALQQLSELTAPALASALRAAGLGEVAEPFAAAMARATGPVTEAQVREEAAAAAVEATSRRWHHGKQRQGQGAAAAAAAAAAATGTAAARDATPAPGAGTAAFARSFLEQCAEFMPMQVQPYDARVGCFRPDPWQTALLDAVDDGNVSILVHAPTSTGKTFLSYYVVSKCLTDPKAGDQNLVVMVAPTKALANQMVATLHAKFSKRGKA
ncbi:MAG: DEAD/DEAH box helicase, partial [Allorhizobium sp.]